MGDRQKYKGKGLIQLAWKNIYKSYSGYSGVDYTAFPLLVSEDMHAAIDVSCWYWRNKGSIYKKYDAKGDINILIENEPCNVDLITLAVNGGSNGLEERKKIFAEIAKEWGMSCA
ncbi:hypothetical protein ACIPK7_26125 [Pseudomonas sp. NPDC086581]|uniref:hypothetical protein n=1 Tax=Pseudomonas sp. NPDC086581 TaxID=3364432 RepID=UPI0038108C44